MLKKYALLLCLAVTTVPAALHGQASPTASKVLDIQVGGSFVGALAGYPPAPPHFKGFGVYSTIDFLRHVGLVLELHQVYAPSPNIEYERTYEIGGRYVLHYGRLHPYAKAMYGRGVFNFPIYSGSPVEGANLGYNLFTLGGGVDFRLKPYLNLRADYEWQKWGSDSYGIISNGISPQLFSVGAAYHFR